MSSADDPDGELHVQHWLPAIGPSTPASEWPGFVDEAEDDELLVADIPSKAERLRRWLIAALEEEREAGTPFLLMPIAFALGSITYFLAPREPDGWAVTALVVSVALLVGMLGWRGRPFVVALALVVAGFGLGKVRTAWVDTPVVAFPTVGALQGTVVWTERRAGGAVRYTVRVSSLEIRGGRPPRVVRIVDRRPTRIFAPGEGMQARVRLIPPSGPVVPSGYDFAFFDWFQGRGAIGSILGEAKLGPAEGAAGLSSWRFAISERIAAGMPESTAALARALIIGDRAGIEQELAEDLRMSGLAHILAISGLHMMLVTGLVFITLRKLCALASADTLRLPVKKWAALGALGVAAVYLLLSGMNVSTQRAFVMVCIMLGAVLLDRQAVTLRNVAIAALIVLAWQPEAIFAPGFQMSFAAAAALVSCYAALLRWRAARTAEKTSDGPLRSGLAWLGGLSFTSLVAGFATSPFAAYHFHRIALLSLAGNLLAMPLVTFLVMPLAVLSVVTMPLGLDVFVLPLLGWSLEGVAMIAAAVASWDMMARTGLVPNAAFALASAGFCALVILRSRLRWLGVAPALLAATISGPSDVVAVASENGRNVAAIESEGLTFSAGSSKSFANSLVAESFPRRNAGKRFDCDPLGCAHRTTDGVTIAVSKDARSTNDDCRLADIIVSRVRLDCPDGSNAFTLDGRTLRRQGSALIIRAADGAFEARHAYGAYRRPWTRHRHPQ